MRLNLEAAALTRFSASGVFWASGAVVPLGSARVSIAPRRPAFSLGAPPLIALFCLTFGNLDLKP